MWHGRGVRAQSEGIKGLRHPVLGAIELEYSAFAVSGRPGLRLVIWNPVSTVDAERIKTLLAGRTPGKHVARHDRLNVLEPAFED